MLPECPEDLKHLLPYLQRASELRAREPPKVLGGYYAVNLALTKGYPKNKTNDNFLSLLFDQLEQEKKELEGEPAMHDDHQARALVLQFAMRIFLAADNEDRAGQASKKTGRLFLVASQFLEVTRALGNVPEEIEDRIKYAKWKAADIIKALNDGHQPQPGPPSTSPPLPLEQNLSSDQSHPPVIGGGGGEAVAANLLPSMSGQFPTTKLPTLSTGASLNSVSPPLSSMSQTGHQNCPPSPFVVDAAPPPPTSTIILPPINQPGNANAAAVPFQSHHSTQEVSRSLQAVDSASLASAEKYARYSISAIQFEDIPTAIQNMELALNLLKNIKRK